MLGALGRLLEVFPGCVLIDPDLDPLVIARRETPATSPFLLGARELEGGALVPEQSWVAKRGSATSVVDDAPAPRRLLEVAPILNAAGWYHPAPVVAPVSLAERGTLVRFTNVTGLVAGETTLGDEMGSTRQRRSRAPRSRASRDSSERRGVRRAELSRRDRKERKKAPTRIELVCEALQASA